MYRIELAPGEETVFRTIEELAIGVRNGLVTPRCRIYHSASQKWLPIEFHPHYKQALSLPAARVAEAVAPRTSGHPPPLETLSFAVAPAARPTPVAEPVAEPRPPRRGRGFPQRMCVLRRSDLPRSASAPAKSIESSLRGVRPSSRAQDIPAQMIWTTGTQSWRILPSQSIRSRTIR